LFFRGHENVALDVAAGEVLGVGRRTLDLPGAWGAVVSRVDGSDTIVASGGTVDGADARSVLFVRVLPFDVLLPEERMFSRDGFECRARTRLRFVMMPEREELAAFRSTVLAGRRVAMTESIARMVAPIVTKTLTSWLAARTAEQMFTSELAGLPAVLGDALKPLLFTSGLTLCGEPVVELDSAGFTHLRRTKEDASRRAGEVEAQAVVHRATAQVQAARVDHLTDVVAKLERLTEASPGASLVELVRTFPLTERSQVFEAVFAEGERQVTKWIAVAAGEELLFFDPWNTAAPVRRFSISGPAGAIRSVRFLAVPGHKRSLLLGAATGVYRVPLDGEEPDAVWLVPHAPRTRGGFNSVCVTPLGVFASHSELGLWRWTLDDPSVGEPWAEKSTRGAQAVRAVQCDGDRVFCAIDDRVVVRRGDGSGEGPSTVYAGSRATIASLCVTATEVFAGNGAGEVLRWSRDMPGRPERLHHGAVRAVESLWCTEAGGVRRLVFTDTSPFVHALVLDEGCATRYEAGGQTLRRAEAASDLLAGMTELRDRFLLWKIGQPRVPFATVNVVEVCGHTVQDICLIPTGA